ncbi:hypothetical protein PSHT_04476 [Puccinia striiformis]|uniref:Uncharacterized protein n=3 Tax=Puccinia striiformis TaxID=27350 RepID=A0A2S4WCS2_9BASI|nr:hypothetical protein PSHT_04476 [Puccinia striiformis]
MTSFDGQMVWSVWLRNNIPGRRYISLGALMEYLQRTLKFQIASPSPSPSVDQIHPSNMASSFEVPSPTNKTPLHDAANGYDYELSDYLQVDLATPTVLTHNRANDWAIECPWISWTLLEAVTEEAFEQPAAYQIPNGIDDFIDQFSRVFLDPKYLLILRNNLHELSNSKLGIEYTLRHQNAAILQRILNDHDRKPQTCDPPEKVQMRISGKVGKIVAIKTVEGFQNPDKNLQHHKLTISERSLLFRDHHEMIPEIPSPTPITPTTRIFYGARRSSVWSIQQGGMCPLVRPNELSLCPSLYTTNDPQQASEQPLHDHPAYPPGSPVAVFQFDMPTAVLHGHSPPTNDVTPFLVKQFTSGEDLENWGSFCCQNMDKNHCGFNHD